MSRAQQDSFLYLIISDLAKDSAAVQFFDNILQLEDFSSLNYLSLVVKEEALAKYKKVKEQRNWIKEEMVRR